MDNEIRFALTTSLDPIKNIVLAANFDQVEEQLSTLLEPYNRMVVAEDDMANAKAVLARIRKVKTSIDEYRKSIKREYSAPLTAFESRVKELLAVCAESEENLSTQINKFERQRREAKMAALEQFFRDNIGSLAPYLTWEQVKNDRWGNATFSEADAQAEMAAAMDACETGIAAIRSLNSPFAEALLNAYAKNHDLAGAMKLNGELTEQKRREDERKAAMEAAKTSAGREEVQTVQRMAERKIVQEPPPVEADKLYSLTLQFWGTQNQLVKLRQYLDDAGIRFKKVE